MGRGLREVAADVVCTLGMEEDEGKIDALAVSLAEAANNAHVAYIGYGTLLERIGQREI